MSKTETGYTIGLARTDVDLARSTTEILFRQGYRVVSDLDNPTFVEELGSGKQNPDLVVLGGLHGMDLARKLNEEGFKVLVWSGLDFAEECEELGISYLGKPNSPEEFLDTLDRLLDISQDS